MYVALSCLWHSRANTARSLKSVILPSIEACIGSQDSQAGEQPHEGTLAGRRALGPQKHPKK
eukprot:5754283-Amphidinium_carterae.1